MMVLNTGPLKVNFIRTLIFFFFSSHLIEFWRFGIVGWVGCRPKASIWNKLGLSLKNLLSYKINKIAMSKIRAEKQQKQKERKEEKHEIKLRD